MSVNGLAYQTGFSGIKNTDIASFLKRSFDSSENDLATKLIQYIEEEVCRRTNRNFKIDDGSEEANLIEYYEEFNAGATKYMPQNTPLNSLVKIEIDGVDKTSLYTEGTNYWVYDNFFKFETGLVSNVYADKAVKLTYTLRKFWGYDLVLMIIKWVAYEFLKSENAGVGVNNMSFADIAQSFDLRGFESEKDRVIGRYIDFEI